MSILLKTVQMLDSGQSIRDDFHCLLQYQNDAVLGQSPRSWVMNASGNIKITQIHAEIFYLFTMEKGKVKKPSCGQNLAKFTADNL